MFMVLALLLIPLEAHLSSVHIMPMEANIKNDVERTRHIVIAKHLNKLEKHKEIVLPKETHYLKEHTSSYTEEVMLLEVTDVLFSKNIKIGQTIKVLIDNNYSLSDITVWHEDGRQNSPSVLTRISKWNPSGKLSILFLYDYEGVFSKQAEEGLEGKEEILELIKYVKATEIAEFTDTKKRLTLLPDLTSSDVNPVAGETELEEIVRVIETSKINIPFVYKIVQRHIAGHLKNGDAIAGGPVYVVNPMKTSGILGLKQPLHTIINEPEWSQLIHEDKILTLELEKTVLQVINL